jgi:hypothetical protein
MRYRLGSRIPGKNRLPGADEEACRALEVPLSADFEDNRGVETATVSVFNASVPTVPPQLAQTRLLSETSVPHDRHLAMKVPEVRPDWLDGV